MKFCYFGSQHSFLPSVFWSFKTRNVLNLKGRTIFVTPEKQKLKEGRSKGVTLNWRRLCLVPFVSSLPCVFAFPACQKSSYPCGLELFACCMIQKLKEGRNLNLQNSQIAYEIWNLMRQVSVIRFHMVFASIIFWFPKVHFWCSKVTTVLSKKPRRGRILVVLNFFRKNANVVNHKKTQLDWHTKRGSRRRQKSRYQYVFWSFHFVQLFPKKWKFRKPQEESVRLARPDADPEAQKVQIPVRFLKFSFFATCFKKMQISKNTK